MKNTTKLVILGMTSILFLSGMLTASATCGCNEGLSPGFWKNHTNQWHCLSPCQTLTSAGFIIPAELAELRNVNLIDALKFKGGNGEIGMARILLRSAVAALLNACDPDINYPLTSCEIKNRVNSALDGSRCQMECLYKTLDYYNNLGLY